MYSLGAGPKSIFADKEGMRFGSHLFDSAKAWIKTDGSYKFKSTNGDVILDSENANGNFINIVNSALNTSSKKVLKDFTFESTDYAGALKTGNVTWNASTGLPTGGTGFLINAKGIIGVNGGTTQVSILTDGTATFGGTLMAPNGTFGTITGGIITGATLQTRATSTRVIMGNNEYIYFKDGDTTKGRISCGAFDLILQGVDDVILHAGGSARCGAHSNSFKALSSQAYDLGSDANRWNHVHAYQYHAWGKSGYNPGGEIERGFVYRINQQKSGGNVTNVQLMKRYITICGGIIVNSRQTSSWQDAE